MRPQQQAAREAQQQAGRLTLPVARVVLRPIRPMLLTAVGVAVLDHHLARAAQAARLAARYWVAVAAVRLFTQAVQRQAQPPTAAAAALVALVRLLRLTPITWAVETRLALPPPQARTVSPGVVLAQRL